MNERREKDLISGIAMLLGIAVVISVWIARAIEKRSIWHSDDEQEKEIPWPIARNKRRLFVNR